MAHACQKADADDSSRTCRICLQEDVNNSSELLAPCGCTGSMRWVHESCLDTWLATVLSQGRSVARCELCGQCYLRTGETPSMSLKLKRPKTLAFLSGATVILCVPAATLPHIIGVIYLLICLFRRHEWHHVVLCATVVGLMSVLIAEWSSNDSFSSQPAASLSELHAGVALCYRHTGSIIERSGVFWDPFQSSVVLITDYSQHGAVGLIVNKDLHTDKTAVSSPAPPLAMLRSGFGGPVRTKRGGGWAVLHSVNATVSGSRHVEGSEFWVGGDRRKLAELATMHNMSLGTPFFALIVWGYAGWAPKQLDGQIRRGMWTVHNVTAALIFETPADRLREVLCTELK